MEFVEPVVNGYIANDFIGGLKIAELAGRNCYKSESKCGDFTAFLNNIIVPKEHYSILEHAPLYFMRSLDMVVDPRIESIINSPYSRTSKFGNSMLVYTNMRVVIENFRDLALSLLKCDNNKTVQSILKSYRIEQFKPDPADGYTRITCFIRTLRSITDELVRERIMSSAVESTRWCNYNKKGLTFCLPHYIDHNIFNECFNDVNEYNKTLDIEDALEAKTFIANYALGKAYNCKALNKLSSAKAYLYISNSFKTEIMYLQNIQDFNLIPEDAREDLSLKIKSDIVYTGYNKDWDRVIAKRAYDRYGKAHPNMHKIMLLCENHIKALRENE